MRQAYFNLLNEIGFISYYYTEYYARLLWAERISYIFCAVVACTSVSGLAAQSLSPWIWSFLIAISQAISIAYPHLPYGRRKAALEYMVPRVRKLKVEIERDFDLHRFDASFDFTEMYNRYYSEFHQIDLEFLGADDIPDSNRLIKKAASKQDFDIATRYQMVKKGDGSYEYHGIKTQEHPPANQEQTEATHTGSYSCSAAKSITEQRQIAEMELDKTSVQS